MTVWTKAACLENHSILMGLNIAGGSSSQSPDTSDLERLSDELDSDFSNMSMADNATAFDPSSGGWKASKRASAHPTKNIQRIARKCNGLRMAICTKLGVMQIHIV